MRDGVSRVRAFGVLALSVLGACTGSSGTSGTASSQEGRVHNEAVYDAWRTQRSHLEVTAGGSIAHMLGTRVGRSGTHEGFLLHLSGAGGRGLTVRVEDNIDLTGPIPLAAGSPIEVRGEYIYDPRGGLIHYTHRDPRGRHTAGYVLVNGRFYQ